MGPKIWPPFEDEFLPDMGDVLLCYIPYRRQENAIIHAHPVIVYKRYGVPGKQLLGVIGGTSVHAKDGAVRPKYGPEIELCEDQQKLAGLLNATKFKFDDDGVRIIPFTEEFVVADDLGRPKVLGSISLDSGKFWGDVLNLEYDKKVSSLLECAINQLRERAKAQQAAI